jgi:hypothetical protein
MAKRGARRREAPPAEDPGRELALAFGKALTLELGQTYESWMQANAGKEGLHLGEVACALVYFAGGALVRLYRVGSATQPIDWEAFVGDVTRLLQQSLGDAIGASELASDSSSRGDTRGQARRRG